METIWWTIEGALGDDVIRCLLVCSAVAGSTLGKTPSPHVSIEAPYPVRSLLSLTQACCERSGPGQHFNGETIYSRSLLVDGCNSADHILATQWVFISLCRAVDRRSFPLVAKGRQDFSLGCVSSLVMVWRRR